MRSERRSAGEAAVGAICVGSLSARYTNVATMRFTRLQVYQNKSYYDISYAPIMIVIIVSSPLNNTVNELVNNYQTITNNDIILPYANLLLSRVFALMASTIIQFLRYAPKLHFKFRFEHYKPVIYYSNRYQQQRSLSRTNS